jgi:hypothetical protein
MKNLKAYTGLSIIAGFLFGLFIFLLLTTEGQIGRFAYDCNIGGLADYRFQWFDYKDWGWKEPIDRDGRTGVFYCEAVYFIKK